MHIFDTKFLSAFCLISLVLMLSSEDIYAQRTVEHPDRSMIPYNEQMTGNEVGNSKSDLPESFSENFTSLKNRFENSRKEIQIGKRDGDTKYMLGRIRDVSFDKNENIYVLDGSQSQIKVFDNTGTFKYTIGKAGPGPGEFQSPTAMQFSNGQLYVSDRDFSIKIFNKKDGKYTYDKSIKTEVSPRSFCIMNGSLYIRSTEVDPSNESGNSFKIIHQYEADSGDFIKSFGEPYGAKSALAVKQLSKGLIACNSKSNLIATNFQNMPYIFAYSGEGEIKWVTKIENFEQRRIVEEIKNGTPSISHKNDGTFDMITNIDFLNDQFMIIQRTNRSGGRRVDPSSVFMKTYVAEVNHGSGKNIEMPNDKWLLMDLNDQQFAVNSMLINKYPSIMVFNY